MILPARAAALLTGLAVAAASWTLLAPAQAHADPGAAAPVVGTCRDYTLRERAEPTDPSAPVDCAGPHTALVLAVVEVSARALRGDRSRALTRADRACSRAQREALGGTAAGRSLLSYSGSLFVPTRAQVRAGARWVRCDLVLVGGNRLQPLPTPLVSNPPEDDIATCIDRRDRVTVCARPHRIRALYAVGLRGAYPATRRDAERVGARNCAAAGRADRQGAYSFDLPSKQVWDRGDKFVTCYAFTRR